MLVGLGLIAAAVGVIAFVRYRERETTALRHDADLARELRDLAHGDDVRLAAVDEFELAIYQRLFYASTVGPRVRSAAWCLLGTALTLTGALVTAGDHGVLNATVHILTCIVAVVFGLGVLTFALFALYHVTSTPRVSFSESYAADGPLLDDAASESASADAESASADVIGTDTASADEDGERGEQDGDRRNRTKDVPKAAKAAKAASGTADRHVAD